MLDSVLAHWLGVPVSRVRDAPLSLAGRGDGAGFGLCVHGVRAHLRAVPGHHRGHPGRGRWAAFAVAYEVVLAYLVALLIVGVGKALGMS